MSMVVCQDCSVMIDSDEDPDCFVEKPNYYNTAHLVNPAYIPPEEWEVLCESCREERADGAWEMDMEDEAEIHKTRIDSLGLSTRTENALESANIRTVGGLVRKKEADILSIEGLGPKGVQEIKRLLGNYGIILK